jgi:hypothetical protein
MRHLARPDAELAGFPSVPNLTSCLRHRQISNAISYGWEIGPGGVSIFAVGKRKKSRQALAANVPA